MTGPAKQILKVIAWHLEKGCLLKRTKTARAN